jgi:hypothetical protein
LTLGIVSILLASFGLFPLGLPLGVAAWVMSRHDLKKMERGEMDTRGYSSTKTAAVCGCIGTVLNSLYGVGIVVLILFMALVE